MTRTFALKFICCVVLSSVATGCGDSFPVQPIAQDQAIAALKPSFTYTPTTRYAAIDDETAIQLDSATGRLAVTILSTNTTVYADLDWT